MNAKKLNKDEYVNMKEERLFAKEELVYNVTEDLLVILEDLEMSKTDLAKMLGKSRSYITQVLSGSRNMTLGSLSDICFALGFKPEIKLPVQEEKVQWESAEYFLDNSWEKLFSKNDLSGKKDKKTIKHSTNVIDRRDPDIWAKAA